MGTENINRLRRKILLIKSVGFSSIYYVLKKLESAGLVQKRDHVYGRYQETGEAPPLCIKAMFDLSLTLIEAELAWIEEFIDELSADQEPGT